jgi:heat shock protein HslJ
MKGVAMRVAAATCLLVLGLLVGFGCEGGDRSRGGAGGVDASGEDDGGDDTAPAGSLEGEWRLEAVRGSPVELAESQRRPTLRILEGSDVGGFGGVNQWGSSLERGKLDEGEFGLGPVTSTLMAGPREAMELENRYFDALRETRRYDAAGVESGELVLRGAGGEELLRFSRAE